MSFDVLTNIQVVNIEEELSNVELLTRMGQVAIDAQWAKPGFIEAVLEREMKFPTGLHTAGVEVAIPHADPEWTQTPGMVVGVCDQAVVFQPMGGMGGEVQAKFVFMLVIPDAEAHIAFLQGLATFIEDETRLRLLEETKDVNRLIEFLSQTVGD